MIQVAKDSWGYRFDSTQVTKHVDPGEWSTRLRRVFWFYTAAACHSEPRHLGCLGFLVFHVSPLIYHQQKKILLYNHCHFMNFQDVTLHYYGRWVLNNLISPFSKSSNQVARPLWKPPVPCRISVSFSRFLYDESTGLCFCSGQAVQLELKKKGQPADVAKSAPDSKHQPWSTSFRMVKPSNPWQFINVFEWFASTLLNRTNTVYISHRFGTFLMYV